MQTIKRKLIKAKALITVNSARMHSFKSKHLSASGGQEKKKKTQFLLLGLKISHYYTRALNSLWSEVRVFVMLVGSDLGGLVWRRLCSSLAWKTPVTSAMCNSRAAAASPSSLCVYCIPLCMNLQGCTLSWLELSWGPQGVIRTPCTFCWTPTTAALKWDSPR